MPDPVVPQAGNAAAQAAAASAVADIAAEGQEPTPKTYSEDEVKALRKEAASWRSKVRELEGKVTSFETAQLSEAEKAQKATQDALAKAQAAEAAMRAAKAETAIAKEAVKHGVAVELLTKLVDVEFDDAGLPINVGAAVTKVLTEFPHLKPALAVSPANPARVAKLTQDDVRRMSRDEINARWDEVQVALRG